MTMNSRDHAFPTLIAEARRRVFMKTGLRVHVLAFIFVSAVMLAINLLTTPGYLWFWFPFFGWLLGVATHAGVVTYLLSTRADRAVREEIATLQGRL
jgi:Flp pilus assembly protein TadB